MDGHSSTLPQSILDFGFHADVTQRLRGSRIICVVVKKRKYNGQEGAKYFYPVERGKLFLAPVYYGRRTPVSMQFWQKELSHYYMENFILNPQAVHFLFFDHSRPLHTFNCMGQRYFRTIPIFPRILESQNFLATFGLSFRPSICLCSPA